MRLSALRSGGLGLALWLFMSAQALAAPPAVTLALSGPATFDAGDQVNYAITYTVTGDAVLGVDITFDMPAGLVFFDDAIPTDATGGCELDPGEDFDYACSWSLQPSVGGTSGQLLVLTRAAFFEIEEGEVLTASVTLGGQYEEAGVPTAIPQQSRTFDATGSAASAVTTSDSIGPSDWIVNPADGEVGLAYWYVLDIGNGGNGRLSPGWTVSDTLPASLRFLEWTSDHPYAELTAPAPFTSGTLTLESPDQLGATDPSDGDPVDQGLNVELRVFLPCSELPTNVGAIGHSWSVDGEEPLAGGGADPKSHSHGSGSLPLSATLACGTGGGGLKTSNPQDDIGEGNNLIYAISFQPPNGVLPIDDVVIVDYLPPEVEFVAVSSAAKPAGEFDTWYCVLPGVPEVFDDAAFLATHQGAGCSQSEPVDASTVTHLVYHAAQWGSSDGISQFTTTTLTRPLLGLTEGTVATNQATLFSAPEALEIPLTDPVTIHSAALPLVEIASDEEGGSLAQGKQFVYTIGAGSSISFAPLANPTLAVTLPPGVDLVSAELLPFDKPQCPWLPAPTTFDDSPLQTDQGDGSTLLVWTFGSVADPTEVPNQCGPGETNYPIVIELTVVLDPEHPFVNGDVFTTTGTLSGANQTGNGTDALPLTVAVPGEIRVRVEPSCDADNDPALLVTYQNTGGTDVDDLIVTVPVPKSGDAGTQIDTTFKPPAAGLAPGQQLLVAGTWIDVVPADLGSVEAVRLTVTTLAPFTPEQEFRVALTVPPGTAAGTLIQGSATIEADNLVAVGSGFSGAIKVALCPGELDLHAFFDEDLSGDQGGAELDLAGWTVTITDTATGIAVDDILDDSGDLLRSLAPGDHTVVLTPPAAEPGDPAPDALFAFAGTSATVTITSGGPPHELTLAVTCGCDDDNSCTTDTCSLAQQCGHQALDNGSSCEDGNPCTEGDTCQNTLCLAGAVPPCPGFGPCFDEGLCNPSSGACDYDALADGTGCDDGDGCSEDDTCTGGSCLAGAPKDCSDSNPCSQDLCAAGVCSHPDEADGAGCDDGDACTQTDACDAGSCTGTDPVLCTASDQCHDAGACDSATGACSNPNSPDDAPCSDGSVCTTDDTCQAGLCVGNSGVDCDDGDPCTVDSCDDGGGCVHVDAADGSSCDDGDACTQTDACVGGACTGANPVLCTALDACHIAGTCDPGSGSCSNPLEADETPCSDGDACSLGDRCVLGSCSPLETIVCTASDTCHAAGVCDPDSGTCSDPTLPDGAGCSDGDACTSGDSCVGGACESGSGVECDDGSSCTIDTCNADTGCTNVATADGTPCDDNDACTAEDVCSDGACVGGTQTPCDDGDDCTGDVCDAAGGCTHPVLDDGTPCDDGEPCSEDDTCQAGVCGSADANPCDDGNPCTADGCGAGDGCDHTVLLDGTPCEDGDACTTVDSCSDGECVAGAEVVCEPSNSCRLPGSCDPTTGECEEVFLPDGQPCDDGDPCTDGDLCSGGECVAAAGQACTPPNACFSGGACNPDTGACEFDAVVGDTPVVPTLTELPSLGPGDCAALDANADGVIVGHCVGGEPLGPRAVSWSGGLAVELTPGANTVESYAFAVGASGLVVGVRRDPAGAVWVFATTPAGGSSLDLWPADGLFAEADQLTAGPNADGTIVGSDGSQIYRWTAGDAAPETLETFGNSPRVGALDDDGVLAGWTGTGTSSAGFIVEAGSSTAVAVADGDPVQPLAIAPDGAIAGRWYPTDDAHGFRLDADGLLTDLGTLGGETSEALFVFEGGLAGHSATTTGEQRAVVWDDSGGITDLGSAGGVTSTAAAARGPWVAGTTETLGGDTRGLLWSEDRGLEVLGTLGGPDSAVTSVLADGRMVGWSQDGAGDQRAFVTAEPGTACIVCDEAADDEPPIIACAILSAPAECAGPDGTPVHLSAPTAYDLCGGPVQLTDDGPPLFALGLTNVVFTATDSAGHASQCATSVTVDDTVAPEFETCPGDIEVVRETEICGAVVAIEATATDACDGAPEVTSNAPGFFGLGETLVTTTATDAAGNTAVCQTQVTVLDDGEPFTIECPSPVDLELAPDACEAQLELQASVTDPCDAELDLLETFTVTAGDSSVTLTVTNGDDETASCSTPVSVSDVTPPVVHCPEVPQALTAADLPITLEATLFDACDADASVDEIACSEGDAAAEPCDVSANGLAVTIAAVPAGNAVVSWLVTATDEGGNVTVEPCSVAVETERSEGDCDDDSVLNAVDNCECVYNPTQTDTDEDGFGDACDLADDGLSVTGGGGCQGGSTDMAPLLAALFALWLVGLRRRRRALLALACATSLALCSVVVAPGQARAETIPVQNFAPTLGDGNYISQQGTWVLEHFQPSFGLSLNYALEPLVITRSSNGEQVAIVEHMLAADLMVGVGLFDAIDVELAMPINLFQAAGSSGKTISVGRISAFTAGDLRLTPKWRILDHEGDGPGFALLANFTFPSGAEGSFAGNKTVTFEPRVVFEWAFDFGLRAAASLGYLVRGEQSYRNVSVANEVTLSAAAQYMIIDDTLAIDGEIWARLSADPRVSGLGGEELPAEFLVAARWWPHEEHALNIGLGRGLSDGYGAPNFRVFVGYAFTLHSPKDRDGDGIVDEDDRCPDAPEDKDGFQDLDGCPDTDNDEDGVLDVADQCPMDPEDPDAWEDEDGCPDPDNDADGVPDVDDKCPNHPEDPDGFEDYDGCDDIDNDKDTILDASDRCPNDPEDYDDFQDDDGCPDPDNDEDGLLDPDDDCPSDPLNKCAVRRTECSIVILDKIHFEFNKAVIKPVSYPILDAVADVLRTNRSIRVIEVQGHTDSVGTDDYNQDLSARRAQSVATYIVGTGVATSRLVPKGYGEDQPIDTNSNNRGRANNRRVEFIMLDPAPTLECIEKQRLLLLKSKRR